MRTPIDTPRRAARIDLQDVLLVAGVILLVGGVAMMSVPAAAMLLGVLFLLGAGSIGRAHSEGKR